MEVVPEEYWKGSLWWTFLLGKRFPRPAVENAAAYQEMLPGRKTDCHRMRELDRAVVELWLLAGSFIPAAADTGKT